MRNMSFMLTRQQIIDGTKTVTRRLGWKFLKPGDKIQACEKCQGLGKGGKIKKLRVIKVISVEREYVDDIIWRYDDKETAREGFPEMDAYEFRDMFCKEMKCQWTHPVTRIEFEYVED